jgi:hypothetical protein
MPASGALEKLLDVLVIDEGIVFRTDVRAAPWAPGVNAGELRNNIGRFGTEKITGLEWDHQGVCLHGESAPGVFATAK